MPAKSTKVTKEKQALAKRNALEQKKKEEELELQAEVELLESVAGEGSDNLTRDDILIPFIKIIQSNSDERVPNSTKHIEGAAEGDICNTATKELVKKCSFIPLVYTKRWMEWGKREKKLGPIAAHKTPEILSQCYRGQDKKLYVHGSNNTVAETSIFFGLYLTEDWFTSVCITMHGSQLKKAKQIMTYVQNDMISGRKGKFRAPLYYRVYNLSTKQEFNDQGQWHGWIVERGRRSSQWCKDNNFSFSNFIEFCKKTRKELENEADKAIYEIQNEQVGPTSGQQTNPDAETPPEQMPPESREYDDKAGDIPF